MGDKPEVLFQILSTGQVRAELVVNLALMAHEGVPISLFLGHAGYMPSDRSMGAEQFLKTDDDILIQCDQDMVPPLDAHRLALEMGDFDIVGLTYLCGSDNGPMLAAKGLDTVCCDKAKCPKCHGAGTYVPAPWPRKEGEPDTIEVDWVGTGCYAIKRAAIEKMKEKYGRLFDYDFDEVGGKRSGCDVFMCRRARAIGLKVGLNRALVAAHAKKITLAPMPDGTVGDVVWGCYWYGDQVPKGVAERRSLPDVMKKMTDHPLNAVHVDVDVRAERPIALDSYDHTHPKGARNDSTRCPALTEELVKAGVRSLLDLGCAGGGFVADCYAAGMLAIGLEGSDVPLKSGLGAWPQHKEQLLYTCDVTFPFDVLVNEAQAQFDLVTAWEVLEHLHPDRLDQFWASVAKHLKPGGRFAGTFSNRVEPWHQSLLSREQWAERAVKHGLALIDYPFQNNLRPDGDSTIAFEKPT